MTSLVIKYFTNKILRENKSNKFGTEDPYFEHVPATRLGRRGKKLKKRKKALPPGISEHDAKVLTKVKRRAYRLDLSLFNLFGLRFGWSSVIGLVPAIGDVLDALMALMVIRTCGQIEGGLPSSLKAKMMFNLALDFVIGLVPVVGDLADAAYKCNTKNAALLESHLRERGKKNLKTKGQPVPAVDPSEADEFDRMQSEDGHDYIDSPRSRRSAESPRPHQSRNDRDRRDDRDRREPREHREPREPEPARVREGGWSFFGRKRAEPHDEEMGPPPNSGSRGEHRSQRRERY